MVGKWDEGGVGGRREVRRMEGAGREVGEG